MNVRALLLAGAGSLALLAGCTPTSSDTPAPGTALLRVADRLAASGDAGTAAALYRSAIALGQKTPEVRRGLGNALIALGEPQAAIVEFEAALALRQDARSYNGLGVAYDMMGEHERAQEFFRSGLALDPNHRGLAHNYALSLSQRDEKPVAKATAQPVEGPVAAVAPSIVRVEPEIALAPVRTPTTAAPKPVTARMAAPIAKPVPEHATAPAAAPTLLTMAVTEPEAAPEMPTVRATEPAIAAAPTPAGEPEAAPTIPAVAEPEAEPEPVVAPLVLTLPRHEIVPLRQSASTAPLHGTYYRFRLADHVTRDGAAQSRREVSRRAPELQGALHIVAERPFLRAKAGLRYTLTSDPLSDLRAAETACDVLIGRGVECRAEPTIYALTIRL